MYCDPGTASHAPNVSSSASATCGINYSDGSVWKQKVIVIFDNHGHPVADWADLGLRCCCPAPASSNGGLTMTTWSQMTAETARPPTRLPPDCHTPPLQHQDLMYRQDNEYRQTRWLTYTRIKP